jgi:hypothetical protein
MKGIHVQHIFPFVLINFADETQLVIPARSFQEFPGVVADAGLAELVGEEGLAIPSGVDERGSAIVIRFCLHGILLLKEKANDANVYT